ncbi:hypothetical protein [Halorussus halobius]|uniref:hypothetical protein n=1 Tax=Halorussus halobius TaxID=1710537 RepID=UPI0010926826|nr:hypothetical protein [Halorussus halobius]
MTNSDVTTAECPHCAAPVAHLARGCDACGRRIEWSWIQPCRECDAPVEYAESTPTCSACRTDRSVWDGVVARVRRERPHVDLRIATDAVVHPSDAGFVAHAGDPRGQRADYRRPLPDGAGVHVKEFADRYEVHWDRVDPTEDFLGHVLADAPHWLLVGGLVGVKLARWPVGPASRLAGYIKS